MAAFRGRIQGLIWGRLPAPGILLFALLILLFPAPALAERNGMALGYGFGFLNPEQKFGHIEKGSYNFVHLTFFHLSRVVGRVDLVLEPFLAYVLEPEEGLDFGLNIWGRYNFPLRAGRNFYLQLGLGAVHTTVDLREQGTRSMFILQGGFGFQWKNFFLENRFRHYSNGGLVFPNRSVHANIISLGLNF